MLDCMLVKTLSAITFSVAIKATPYPLPESKNPALTQPVVITKTNPQRSEKYTYRQLGRCQQTKLDYYY